MVIKAENGVLNLNEMFFNGSMQTEKQLPNKSSSVDSFARTLDDKVSERIESRRLNEKKGLNFGKSKDVKKKLTTSNTEHDRMPKPKVNKENELKTLDDKLDELKKALKESKGKTTPEIEEMFAGIMESQEISEEQLIELGTIMQEFVGMEELVLSQPIMDILDELPDDLVKKVNQLVTEITNGKNEIMAEHGQLQEKVDQIIMEIEQTISNLELEGELKSQEDLVNVLELIKSTLSEAVQGDKVVNLEPMEQIQNLSEMFKMVESIEKKDSKNNVEKLHGLMNQKSLPVEVEAATKVVETKPQETVTAEGSEAKTTKEPVKETEETILKAETTQKAETTSKGERTVGTETKEVSTEEAPKENRSQVDVKDGGFKEVLASQSTDKTSSQSVVNQTVVEQTSEQALGIKEVAQINETQTVKMVQTQRNIMNQVIDGAKMNFNLEDETSEMLIKLKPHSLGNVELKVSIEKGVLMAEFNVESQIVKEALEANLADLRNALSDKGFNIHELNVSVNQDQKQGNGGQFTRRQNSKKSEFQLGSIESVFENASLESLNSRSTIDFLG